MAPFALRAVTVTAKVAYDRPSLLSLVCAAVAVIPPYSVVRTMTVQGLLQYIKSGIPP